MSRTPSQQLPQEILGALVTTRQLVGLGTWKESYGLTLGVVFRVWKGLTKVFQNHVSLRVNTAHTQQRKTFLPLAKVLVQFRAVTANRVPEALGLEKTRVVHGMVRMDDLRRSLVDIVKPCTVSGTVGETLQEHVLIAINAPATKRDMRVLDVTIKAMTSPEEIALCCSHVFNATHQKVMVSHRTSAFHGSAKGLRTTVRASHDSPPVVDKVFGMR